LIELSKPFLGSWVLLRSLRIVDRLKMKTTTTKEMGKGRRGNRVRESSSEKVRVPMRRVTGVWSGEG
jgi:hypothetical protein